ncbi:DUF2752 domain-containing protein [Natranaerobius thermophilus]|uniref:DUF2752 domain-containing protein n=1 Tax=Natranaerobius thermophilus (strain ATCC BAA-1301 / DSM 18059 / JW/NM-WN-LF) TaxID=457570 RepID=B2A869_NATTJ|nr:DUF2752 domain-containing protein [Natranaerobius thermophilus]ACB84435.1 conserved hypothetical protein [Natranaerobius thermophilus JW/NM-WN-LF]
MTENKLSRLFELLLLIIFWTAMVLSGLHILSDSFTQAIGYKGCWFYLNTGLKGPTCGGTRAAQALLQLDIISSVQYNALLLPGGPLLLYFGVKGSWLFIKGKSILELDIRPAKLMLAVVVVTFYSVLRNLFI